MNKFTQFYGYCLIRTNHDGYEFNGVHFSSGSTVSRQFIEDQKHGFKRLEIREVFRNPENYRSRIAETPIAIWESRR